MERQTMAAQRNGREQIEVRQSRDAIFAAPELAMAAIGRCPRTDAHARASFELSTRLPSAICASRSRCCSLASTVRAFTHALADRPERESSSRSEDVALVAQLQAQIRSLSAELVTAKGSLRAASDQSANLARQLQVIRESPTPVADGPASTDTRLPDAFFDVLVRVMRNAHEIGVLAKPDIPPRSLGGLLMLLSAIAEGLRSVERTISQLRAHAQALQDGTPSQPAPSSPASSAADRARIRELEAQVAELRSAPAPDLSRSTSDRAQYS